MNGSRLQSFIKTKIQEKEMTRLHHQISGREDLRLGSEGWSSILLSSLGTEKVRENGFKKLNP